MINEHYKSLCEYCATCYNYVNSRYHNSCVARCRFVLLSWKVRESFKIIMNMVVIECKIYSYTFERLKKEETIEYHNTAWYIIIPVFFHSQLLPVFSLVVTKWTTTDYEELNIIQFCALLFLFGFSAPFCIIFFQ